MYANKIKRRPVLEEFLKRFGDIQLHSEVIEILLAALSFNIDRAAEKFHMALSDFQYSSDLKREFNYFTITELYDSVFTRKNIRNLSLMVAR
jgi:hypothetical protein